LFKANRISGKLGYGGVLIIPVELDGVTLRFIVDTGAAYCSVTHKALDKIIAKPTTAKRSIAPIGKEIVPVSTLQVDNFVVGGLTKKDFLMSIIVFPDGFQIDGLLGMDFMGKYRITIESDTATLILRQIQQKNKVK
jgi:predicted aspartyl protease